MPRPEIALPGYARRGSLGVRIGVGRDSAALKFSDAVGAVCRVTDDPAEAAKFETRVCATIKD